RARRAAEHDAQHIGVDVIVHELTKAEQLASRLRREPVAQVAVRPLTRGLANALARRTELALEHKGVVAASFHLHQEAIEGSDVRAGRVEPRLRSLHECPSGARERIEDVLPSNEVALQERLDELRDEFAEIRVEPVDVLRPLALGEVCLRPGEIQVELAIKGVLRRGHGLAVFGGSKLSPGGFGGTALVVRVRLSFGGKDAGSVNSQSYWPRLRNQGGAGGEQRGPTAQTLFRQ